MSANSASGIQLQILKPHGKAGYHVMQLKIRWCYPYDFDPLCHDLFWQLYFWLASSLERSLFELPRDRNVRTGNKLRVLDCLLECSTKIKVTGTLQRDLSCKHITYADWMHMCSGREMRLSFWKSHEHIWQKMQVSSWIPDADEMIFSLFMILF